MKRHLLTLVLSVAATASHASAGAIRFVGALVEPTCQTENLERPANLTLAALRLSECRTSFVMTADARSRAAAAPVFTSSLKEIALSDRTAALVGRSRIQEVVINYQ